MLLQLDPNNVATLNNVAVALGASGDSLWALGRLDGAIDSYRKALRSLGKAVHGGAFFIANYESYLVGMGSYQAISGNLTGAVRTAASGQAFLESNRAHLPQGSGEVRMVELYSRFVQVLVSYERDEFADASRLAAEAIEQMRNAKLVGPVLNGWREGGLSVYSQVYGRAEYQLDRFAPAESALRAAVKWDKISAPSNKRQIEKDSAWLAMALARQGKRRERQGSVRNFV